MQNMDGSACAEIPWPAGGISSEIVMCNTTDFLSDQTPSQIQGGMDVTDPMLILCTKT